ncbi:MAG: sortase [Chloroflexi bacterium]|nr:sortase [Chloroflexota bacterium]
MVEVPSADEVALHKLEQVLYEKRRPISERKLRTLAAAEQALDERRALVQHKPESRLSVYPPASWRGAGEQDRYFRSLRLYPLTAHLHWVLPAPGAAAAPAVSRSAPQAALAQPKPRWGQRVLTAIEVLAAVALVVVVAQLYRHLQSLQAPVGGLGAPTAPVAVRETVVPTPAALALLPGGHAAPTGAGQGLGDTVRAEVVLNAPPTPGPRTAQRLEIPAIQVDAIIVQGDTDADLMMGVGQHLGSADPGQPGNMVLSAHNDIYGQTFRDLDKLAAGDEVLVHTDAGAYRYVVHTVEIVEPTRVEVMEPTEHAALTMITCYPYLLDTHRVVVVADLAE